MEEKDFNEKYWQNSMKLVTVRNPTKDDYTFQATIETGVDITTGKAKTEQRHYIVKGGAEERLVGPVANMYLDQMSKIIAQNENKFQHMIDYSLRAQYYDRLIVDIEDLVNHYTPHPQYIDEPAEVKDIPEPVFVGKPKK